MQFKIPTAPMAEWHTVVQALVTECIPSRFKGGFSAGQAYIIAYEYDSARRLDRWQYTPLEVRRPRG